MSASTMTRHTELEAAHAVAVRRGQADSLKETNPVPDCRCPRCVLLAMRRRGQIEPAVADVVLGQVLTLLAEKIPAERKAVAERLRQQWAESALIVLPKTKLLIQLASRMPGARKAPRSIRDDRDPLPIEAARRAPIVDVCDRLGVALRRVGRSWRGDCPFHDSESGTSFSVDADKGLFYCHGCGAGGDTIDLLRRVEGVGFATAVRRLAS